MTTIKQEDFIQSIADAYQFISYYHPVDFIKAMAAAYEHEESPAAKNAIAQILINARMAAEGHRPICQDTGIAVVYLKVGMNVRWDATLSVTDMVSEGVRRAYTNKENPLRGSIVADPDGTRKNTRDNSPAVVHMELVPGDKVDVKLAAKGGGSESKTKFAVLNPSDSVVDWVLEQVPTMGGDWCPPGMLGKTGLIGSIGKSERGAQTVQTIKKYGGAHLIAVGGAAYLVSKAVKASKVLAFGDLGMEAIYEFDVKDMPVTVAVDATGNAVHDSGPREWRSKIGKIPVKVV